MQHRRGSKDRYQLTTLIAVALLVMIMFVAVGYFFMIVDSERPPERPGMQATLDTNRELWDSRRPVAFRYVVERHCQCDIEYRRPYTGMEQDGYRTAQFSSPLQQDSTANAGAPPEPLWLDDIFDLLVTAIGEARVLNASYDPGFGFPTNVSIDWSSADDDDALRIIVRDFEVIEYRQ